MNGKFWRDVAMTIYFSDEQNDLISTLTFTINYDSLANKIIFIVGIQGGSHVENLILLISHEA
jgi:uncharacterized protein VirK/YbjX